MKVKLSRAKALLTTTICLIFLSFAVPTLAETTSLFGDGESVISDPSNHEDIPYSLALDDSYLYVAGKQSDYDVSRGVRSRWRIEKRDKTTGALITAFGTAGVVESNPSNLDDVPFDLTLDSHYLYIVGYASSDSDFGHRWRIEKRDKITGMLVTGFGANGVVEVTPRSAYEAALAVTLDSLHLYIAGYDESPGNNDSQWRIEKRDKTTGALIADFGAGGVVESNQDVPISGPYGGEIARAITVDDSYIYIAGCDFAPKTYQMRIEKRDKITGDLVTDFGTGGMVQNWPTRGQAYTIAIDSSSIYVAGYSMLNNMCRWHIEKRDKTTGSLMTTFSNGGMVTLTDMGESMVYALATDSCALYAAGYDFSGTGGPRWRIEKRDKTTGAAVTDFGVEGVLGINPSRSYDIAYDIAIDSLHLYIAGKDNSPDPFICTGTQWRIEKRDKTTSAGYILVRPQHVDFGLVLVGSASSPTTVTVTNNTSDNVTMGTVSITGSSGDQFLRQNDFCSGRTLSPGDPATLEIVFRPTSFGQKTAALLIPFAHPTQGSTTMPLSGQGLVGIYQSPPTVVAATGSGNVTFQVISGATCNTTAISLTAIPEEMLSEDGKPSVSFVHGFFNFTVSGVTPGGEVTVGITLPSAIPIGAQYWKYHASENTTTVGWVNATAYLGDDDGDNVLTLTITDGGVGDDDGIANGIIVDPGGPGIPPPPLSPPPPSPQSPTPSPTLPSTPPPPPTEQAEGQSTGEGRSTIIRSADMKSRYLNITPHQAYTGQPVTIATNVINSGGESCAYRVDLRINGQVEETKTVSVGPGSAQQVKFTVYKNQPGTYSVAIGSEKNTFTVIAGDKVAEITPVDGGVIAFLIFGALVLATIITLLFAFRRPER